MKILYVSRTFYPEIKGGGEVSAFYIAKSIIPHAQAVVCTLSERINEPFIEEKEGVKIYRFPWKKNKHFQRISNLEYCYWQMYRAVKKVVKLEKPDAIHFLNFGAIFPLALGFRKYSKFATCNGPWFCNFGGYHEGKSCYKCTFKEKIRMSFHKWGIKALPFLVYTEYSNFLLRVSLKRCTKVFPVSKAMEKMLIANHIPPKKITIIHNPIEIRDKIRTDLKKKMNIGKKKVLLFVGRLAEDKGIQYVLESLPYLREVIYVVVGRGPFRSELKKNVERLNVGDKVRFVGFVDERELINYYSIAEGAILIEKFYEPLSRMLLDAQSYGIPCLVNDVGGNTEIISDGENGYVVKGNSPLEISKKIKEMLKRKKEYGIMVKKAKVKISKEFSLEKIGSLLIEEYKDFENE